MAQADRLKRNRDFSRVYRLGTYRSGRQVGLHFYRNRGKHARQSPRVGFTVSRSTKGAVSRNRARRLLRESFRLCTVDLFLGYDLIITARWDPGREPALGRLIGWVEELIVEAGAGQKKTANQDHNDGCVR